jgi:hypothetical protein
MALRVDLNGVSWDIGAAISSMEGRLNTGIIDLRDCK